MQTIFPNKNNGYFLNLAEVDRKNYSNPCILEKGFNSMGIYTQPNTNSYENLKDYRSCKVYHSVVSEKYKNVKLGIDNISFFLRNLNNRSSYINSLFVTGIGIEYQSFEQIYPKGW